MVNIRCILFTVLLLCCLVSWGQCSDYSSYQPRRSGIGRSRRNGEFQPPNVQNQNTREDEEEEYPGDRDEASFDQSRAPGRPLRREREESKEFVQEYMKSFPTKVLVALSAAMGTFLLSSFISNMIVSQSNFAVNSGVALTGLVFTFLKGHIADFFKALGIKKTFKITFFSH